MAYTLGWKDILRPIRDGYRHLFPTPDTGPTPEERRKRREQDRLKGFAYFDTFDQLETWSENDSDPLQRANTPILRRYQPNDDDDAKATVILCHDYAGNYHDYEGVQGIALDDEMYACEYLSYIDTFIYFSHKLACVPPPPWTNTLHRNGVRALGTILLEPQTSGSERLLQQDENGSFILATKLAQLTRHYGFDGWLVNIEKPFPNDVWDLDVFRAFLEQLREELRNLGDENQLIWYDALTMSNEVSYQNGLTLSNLPFTKACGSILTNYCWTERHARESVDIARQHGFPTHNIYFGIDVWAQNTTKLTQPRTTYPKRGGGGTNTGVAVAKLAESRLSACIFAPAWSYEHFSQHGRDVERAVWEGQALPEDLTCSCGNAASRHQSNKDLCVIQNARTFTVGSEDFFYTDFTRAFARHDNAGKDGHDSRTGLYAQLGAQSILPLAVPSENRTNSFKLSHRVEMHFGYSELVIVSQDVQNVASTADERFNRWLPLYKLDMPANGSLCLKVSCRNPITSEIVAPSLYMKFSDRAENPDSSDQLLQLLAVPHTENMFKVEKIVKFTANPGKDVRLAELGVHLGGLTGQDIVPVLEIFSISIAPIVSSDNYYIQSIADVHIESRGTGENKHERLCWSFKETGGRETGLDGVPYSETTGPFSYFAVEVNGVKLARAYALECILPREMIEDLRGKDVEVKIAGVGFGGTILAVENKTLRTSNES